MGFSVAISAGEASGDLHGAELAKQLGLLLPNLHVWGAGGTRMRGAGVEIVADMAGCGTISIAEALKAIPHLSVRYFRLRRELLRREPDLFVPIDFGAFNIRLAQTAHNAGIRVVYYFPPSSWRRKPRDPRKLLACGGRVVTPFPWSAELLSSQGVEARFVGHPLVDIAKATTDRQTFLDEMGLEPGYPLIGLFPGSRSHEVSEHVAPMMGCAQIVDRELGGAQFVLGATPAMADDITRRVKSAGASGGPTVKVCVGRAYDCMAHSDLIITSSGTATLEAAIIGVPMVIIYRGSRVMRFEYILRSGILEEFIGMPNIVAGKGVCPELLGADVSPVKLADTVLSLLKDRSALDRMRSDLSDVRKSLGEPGAVERTARAVAELGGLS